MITPDMWQVREPAAVAVHMAPLLVGPSSRGVGRQAAWALTHLALLRERGEDRAEDSLTRF